jgi:hypothetical protein
MSLDVETIIQVANELKEAQERVKFLEGKLRVLTGGDGNALAYKQGVIDASVLTGIMGPDDSSLPEKIITLLDVNPTWNFSFGDIFKVVGGTESYLRSTLARLIKEERIASKGWGKYGSIKKGLLARVMESEKEKAQNP